MIDLQATLTGPDTYTVTALIEVPLRRRLAAVTSIVDAEQLQAGLVVV